MPYKNANANHIWQGEETRLVRAGENLMAAHSTLLALEQFASADAIREVLKSMNSLLVKPTAKQYTPSLETYVTVVSTPMTPAS